MPAILELRGILKNYGPTAALAGVDFAAQAGQVHALLGENGAGKTTLMRIAFGLEKPDRGAILVAGTAQSRFGPVRARRCGLGMVHQHFTSIPAFTVAENIALTAGWSVRRRQPLHRRVLDLTERLGLELDPSAVAGDLSVSLKQRLEIVKALATRTRLLLLDEPTAVLAPPEVSSLLDFLRRFAEGGGSVVLITHKLREAMAAADRITVLRRGRVAYMDGAGRATAAQLANAMLGNSAPAARPSKASGVTATGVVGSKVSGPVMVAARSATVLPDGPGPGLRQGDFTARAGEVVGVAAVEGNGQRELLRAIAGLLPLAAGTMTVAGTAALIPEDRTTEGVVENFTVTENLVLHRRARAPWLRSIGPIKLVDWNKAAGAAEDLVRHGGIKAAAVDQPVRALSGGNQQKLVVARVLGGEPRVVVAENPARGLDPAAARSVFDSLRAAAAAGSAVIVYSSDLDEVLEVSDRVVVLRDGTVLEPAGRDPDRGEIGRLMLG